MNILNAPFAEHSVAWLLISAGLGGFVGAALRSFFEEVINPRIRDRRNIRQVVRELTTPLIRSTDSLRGRILNLLANVRHEGIQIRDDDQYRLSTLYLFAQFLAWVRILEQQVFFLDFESSRQSRAFNIRLNSIFKGFTSLFYFQPKGERPPAVPTVYRTVLSAIGESAISSTEGGKLAAVGFAEFVRRIETEPEFHRWVSYLEEFLDDLKPAPEDTRWDRLVIISAQLDLLLWRLDPKQRRTRKREIDLHYMLHPVAIQRFRVEIERSGFPENRVRWPHSEEGGESDEDS